MMEPVIQTWYDLIAIESVSGYEKPLADYLTQRLEALGLAVETTYFEADTDRVRPSIWTHLKGDQPGPTLMLIGHMDTVAPVQGWATDPFTPTPDVNQPDKVYGLGAMDMKGGLAAILETVTYYSQHPDQLHGSLLVCFVSDEEVLSQGTYQLVKEGLEADYAIMAECRFDSMAIGFRGRYSFDVVVEGEAGHSSQYPQTGQNAVISAARLALAIEDLPTGQDPQLGSGSWVVRYMEGGNQQTLVVPESAYLSVDRFVVPGESEESCIQQIQAAARSLGLEDQVQVSLRPRDNPYMQSFKLSEDDPLVQALQRSFKEEMGEDLALAYDPSVCDSNILAVQMGIPTVTFGPAGGNMHAANEYGYASQVRAAAAIYQRAVRELLG